MAQLEALPIPKNVVDILETRKPTRIAIFLRTKSPLSKGIIYLDDYNIIVQMSCSSLNIPLDKSHYKLLAIQKWPQLTIVVFDIFHINYDLSTAHHKADLPVILVDYGKRLSYIRTISPEFRERINKHIAQEHDYNGWDVKPPFFQDQTSSVPRTYYFPRSAYPDPAAARASFAEKPRQNSSSTIMPVKHPY